MLWNVVGEVTQDRGDNLAGRCVLEQLLRLRSSERGWGVWDHAVNGWHGRDDLDEQAAKQLADTRNATHRRRHSQPTAAGSRKVDPPKPVVVQIRELYKEAKLDWWVREKDGWHGRSSTPSAAKLGVST